MPIRLLSMNTLWARSTLRFVDAWACRPGRPEDDDDSEAAVDDEGGRDRGIDDRELNDLPRAQRLVESSIEASEGKTSAVPASLED